MKISQVKTNLQTIITNLSQLQTYRDSLTQDNYVEKTEEIAKCKSNVENAFNSLESEEIKETVSKLKKRKTKRIRRTQKIKALKVAAMSAKKVSQLDTPYCTEIPEERPKNTLLKRKARDAKKYLAIIDSLESLHKLRSGGEECKLSESLASIKSIWESTAHDARKELQNPPTIEAQWKRVLFGETSNAVEECGLKEFIERRCTWDSYIVADDDANGSCIPIGWVCPKKDARSDWVQHRVGNA